jgi:hypothetical protein
MNLPLGFVFQTKFAVPDFSCKGQPTNLARPLDHPSEPNIHLCRPNKNAAAAISRLIWLIGKKFRKRTDINFQFLAKAILCNLFLGVIFSEIQTSLCFSLA